MYQKVRKYIKDQHMLERKERIIAGVSGGADSICLLFMLLELKKEFDYELIAVHVNHGLRGESARADEAYVKEVCEEKGVKLFVFHEDVKEYAKKQGISLEDAGRQVRRNCFQKVFEAENADKIALAHHQNDNAETVIWNLCRGSGLRGMGGISPKNGIWIRPLLCLDRGEIESYLENRGISYCTDETNLENDYTRNRIRNDLIPYMETHLNVRTVEHINECAGQLRMIREYMEEETQKYLSVCTDTEAPGRIILRKDAFKEVPDILKTWVIHEILCRTARERRDISSVHVKMVQKLLEYQVGRKAELPYGTEVSRCYEGLCFRAAKTALFCPGDKKNPKAEEVCRMRVFDKNTKTATFPQKIYTKWFDYDIIKNAVKIRHREPGDYIVIDKSGRTQKLKQYFINEKIPREVRQDIWLAADGHEILWIVGYRQSQAYQITERTKKILEIEFYGGKEDGRDC